MQAITTGPAIAGCETEWEELALMFARSAEDPAKALALRRALKQELAQAEPKLPALEAALQTATARLTQARADWERVRVKPNSLIAAPVSAAIVGFLLWIWSTTMQGGGETSVFVFALLVLFAAPAAFLFLKIRWDQELRVALAAAAAAEKAVGEANAELGSVRATIEAAKAALNQSEIKRTVRAVGRVYFPASVHSVGGRSVAVDSSGVARPRSFRLADLAIHSGEPAEIVALIDGLKHPPILLTPNDAEERSQGDLHELHGEERLLRDTVERFSSLLGQIPITAVALPIFERGTAVVTELAQGAAPTEIMKGAVLHAGSHETRQRLEGVRRLNATLGASKAHGLAPKVELLNAHNAIASLLDQYRALRTTSIASIHQQFMNAMERSSWCGVSYHCPKATRNPRWLQQQLGIDFDTAHEYEQDALVSALLSDEQVKSRIAEDPELTPTLHRAWVGISNIQSDIESYIGAAQASTATIGAMPTGGVAVPSAVRHLRAQLDQYITEYRTVLNKIVFGQRRPLVEFSPASRLEFDPDIAAWTNPTTGEEYSDSGELDCSRVLRVHEELLFPMWRHLWTEKSDFRRSELFRTNEQILRMNEKESEKLISVGNQFRDDMRSVREVLKQVQGDLSGKVDQLRGTRDALSSLGLLSVEHAALFADDKLQMASGSGDAVARAEEKETLLALEPAAQAERRGRAADPIDAVFGRAAIFAVSAADEMRRKLAPLSAPVPVMAGGMASGRQLALDHTFESPTSAPEPVNAHESRLNPTPPPVPASGNGSAHSPPLHPGEARGDPVAPAFDSSHVKEQGGIDE